MPIVHKPIAASFIDLVEAVFGDRSDTLAGVASVIAAHTRESASVASVDLNLADAHRALSEGRGTSMLRSLAAALRYAVADEVVRAAARDIENTCDDAIMADDDRWCGI